MIVVTDFLSILNQMEIYLAQNQKENCHHDHISFRLKGTTVTGTTFVGTAVTKLTVSMRPFDG